MSHDLPPSNAAETAAHERGVRALDVIVCVDAPSKGLFRRVRRLLRQCTGETRLIVVDAGRIDALLWSRLQGLAREAGALLLLRHHGAGGPSSVELALAHSAGRDVLLLDGQVQVFSRFVRRLARALGEDERAGIVCPVSNRSPRAVDPSWSSALCPPEGVSVKRWAKLLQRVAPRSRAELVAPDPACMLLRRELLDLIGPPPASTDAAALVRYADAARQRGFRVALADEVYVHHEAGAEPAQAVDTAHPLGRELAWHLQRGSASNRTAPLLLLDGSPFSSVATDGRSENAAVVRALLERLHLPRAVLAYPAASGIELAEILDGTWEQPLVYERELQLPLATPVEDASEAQAALRELIELFQVGFVHSAGGKAWLRVLAAVLATCPLPYCVRVTDESALDGDAAPATLLAQARAVLCPSEAVRAGLCQRYALKPKRVHAETTELAGGDDTASLEARLRAWTAAYDACQSRAAEQAPWLRRQQFARLRALYRGAAPVTLPPAALQGATVPSTESAPLVERWVQRIGRRAPSVLRSAWNRLPYPSKQQRKPR